MCLFKTWDIAFKKQIISIVIFKQFQSCGGFINFNPKKEKQERIPNESVHYIFIVCLTKVF